MKKKKVYKLKKMKINFLNFQQFNHQIILKQINYFLHLIQKILMDLKHQLLYILQNQIMIFIIW